MRCSDVLPRVVPRATPTRPFSAQSSGSAPRYPLRTAEAPTAAIRAPASKPMAAGLWGRAASVASAAALAGALAFTTPAAAQAGGVTGAPLPTAEVVSVPAAQEPETSAITRHQRFQGDLERLERLRVDQRISTAELDRARRILRLIHFQPEIAPAVPRRPSGRIDLLALARGDPADSTEGHRVLSELTREIERRMRLTPRALASGDYVPLEGLPGYQELPQEVIEDLVIDALERVPLGELPLGAELESLIRRLPNTQSLDLEAMALRDVFREVGDAQTDWLRARTKPLLDAHGVELGIGAFAAVTALRASSEEAAELIDLISPRISIYRAEGELGAAQGRFRIRGQWRDRDVLPHIDIEGDAIAPLGERWHVDTRLRGTVAVEQDEIWTLTASVGATYRADTTSAEARLTHAFGGTRDGELRVAARGWLEGERPGQTLGLSAFYVAEAPRDRADGPRWGVDVDVAYPFRCLGQDFEAGVYVGAREDDEDGVAPAAGLTLGLRF